jgi:hypothetical protein
MSVAIKLTDGQIYQYGSYTDYIAAYNKGGLVEGADYSESISLSKLDDPNQVTMSWDWPTETTPSIRSFLAVDYGNYDNTAAATPIASSKISDIAKLTDKISLSLSGDTAGFNVIDDLFLTNAAGGNSAHADEVELFLHASTAAAQWIASAKTIGEVKISGVTWEVAVTTNGCGIPDYLIAPANGQDVTSGTIDLKAMLNYLVSNAGLSSGLYFNGMALGVETLSGDGSLQIKDDSVSYSTTAPTPKLTLALKDATGSTVGTTVYTTDPTLAGKADANVKVTIYDGSTLLASVTADARGDWTYDPTALANGYHDFTVDETNSYGNSASASLATMLNESPINLSEEIAYVAGQAKNGVYSTDPTLCGWTAPDTEVKLYDGAKYLGEVLADSAGYWTEQTRNLSAGSHTLIAAVDDVYGRTATASRTFTIA